MTDEVPPFLKEPGISRGDTKVVVKSHRMVPGRGRAVTAGGPS